MMAPTHIMLGVSAYLAIAALNPGQFPVTAGAIAAASLGSLAPDLDHPGSWIGKRTFFLSIPMVMLFGHRGITHSLLAAAAATAGIGWHLHAGTSFPWLAAFLVGYLLHLVADWNTGGVPLLWPSPRRFRAPWAFSSGGIIEKFFVLAFGAFLAFGGWGFFKNGGLEKLL